jgi:hypothetical protein
VKSPAWTLNVTAYGFAESIPAKLPRRDYTPPDVYVGGGQVDFDHNPKLDMADWFGSYGDIGYRDQMIREWGCLQAATLAWTLTTVSRSWTIDPPKGGDANDLAIAEATRDLIQSHYTGGMLGLVMQFAGLPFEGFVLGQPYYPVDPGITIFGADGRTLREGAHVLQIAPIPAWNVDQWREEEGRNGQRTWGVEVYNVGHDYTAPDQRSENVIFRSDQLVHARFMNRTDNPAPYGLLRSVWALWQQARTFQKLRANGWQKAAFGIPEIVTTPEANPGDVDKVNRIVGNLRAGALARFSLPPGYMVKYHEVPYRAGDLDRTLSELEKSAATALFTQHTLTGRDNGTQALHGSQKQEFHQLAGIVAKTIQQVLSKGPNSPIRRLVTLNFGALDSYPVLDYGPAPISDPLTFIESIDKASAAGFLNPDVTVEERVRSALSLAEMPQETRDQWRARLENGGMVPDVQPPTVRDEGGASDSGEEDEADEEQSDVQPVAASEHAPAAEPAPKVVGDRYQYGPRGRAVRPVETILRFSETKGVSTAGKDEIGQALESWRLAIAPIYGRALEQAETLADVDDIPVPGVDALTRDLVPVLRRVYKAGGIAVENEAERLEDDPDLAEGMEDAERAQIPQTLAESDTHTPPKGVRDAARRALEVRASKPKSQRGMTPVGIARARDLANGKPISVATIRRMQSYFARHEVDKKGSTWDDQGKGWQAWHGWGGDAGRAWANRIIRSEQALADDASTPAPPADRIRGSRRNPEGSASGRRGGIKISETVEKSLRNKVEEHNESRTSASRRVDLGMLKAVYRRGSGAYSVSHRPGMTRNQWAMGRVNSFLRRVAKGTGHSQDDDLLPEGHPNKPKKMSEHSACPAATQSVQINTRNRDATVREFGYGPLNVDRPGDFWEDIAEAWDTSEEAARASLCGNCVAFDISPRMQACMPGPVSDDDGRLGYCHMHALQRAMATSDHAHGPGCGCGSPAQSLDSRRLTDRMALADETTPAQGRRRVRKPEPVGPPVPAIDDIDPNEAIESIARTTAASMADRLREAARRVLQALGIGGALPRDVAGTVESAVVDLSHGVEMAQAQRDTNTIFGLGRMQMQRATGSDSPDGPLYMFSNLAESDTCQFCEQFDGQTYGPDQMAFFSTPFALCEGGDNCNCLGIQIR